MDNTPMTVLNDKEIKGMLARRDLVIDPCFDDFFGPSCYYCHLGSRFCLPQKSNEPIDILSEPHPERYFERVDSIDHIIIEPGEFVLGETFEYLGIDKGHIIRFFNTTSLARWGIGHISTGFVNAGCGYVKPMRLTLELVNMTNSPIKLKCTIIKNSKIIFGVEVIKICVVPLSVAAAIGYQGEYASDEGVSISKMNRRIRLECYDIPEYSILTQP